MRKLTHKQRGRIAVFVFIFFVVQCISVFVASIYSAIGLGFIEGYSAAMFVLGTSIAALVVLATIVMLLSWWIKAGDK